MEILVDAPTRRSMPDGSLVCVNGDDLGRTLRVDRTIVIGRGRADLALSSTDVSRHHARVTSYGGGYVIEDLGSANGTYVDGVRVSGPTPIRFGAHIQIGRTVILFARHDELEERVARVERLETMAVMAGGIAHDFNNALAVIVANLEAVGDALPASAVDARDALSAVRGAATSATELARRLLRLGNRESMTIGIVALTALVDHTLMIVRRRRAAIEIVADVPDDLVVFGSFEELHQTLVNLYFNSCDAMPRGGAFRIAARAVQFDAVGAVQHQLELPGAYIELVVSDTGVGMDAATRARAFEPFFTTKGRDRGTGLGLAMVHRTIRRHGGSIELDSEPGRGTTFHIYLQRAGSANAQG
jgi:signal transduction histidine kinase